MHPNYGYGAKTLGLAGLANTAECGAPVERRRLHELSEQLHAAIDEAADELKLLEDRLSHVTYPAVPQPLCDSKVGQQEVDGVVGFVGAHDRLVELRKRIAELRERVGV